MAPRFPLDEAPNPSAKESITSSLGIIHSGGPQFPILRHDNQGMLGPYGPLSYSTDVAQSICSAAKTAFAPDLVKPRNRELAVMALISTTQLPYMTYCHRLVGARLGLSPEQCNDALTGQRPRDLTEEEATAYRLGLALSSTNSPLSDEDWKEFGTKMDKRQIVGVANAVGGYRWITTLVQLNGIDEKWDGEEKSK